MAIIARHTLCLGPAAVAIQNNRYVLRYLHIDSPSYKETGSEKTVPVPLIVCSLTNILPSPVLHSKNLLRLLFHSLINIRNILIRHLLYLCLQILLIVL